MHSLRRYGKFGSTSDYPPDIPLWLKPQLQLERLALQINNGTQKLATQINNGTHRLGTQIKNELNDLTRRNRNLI